jgi:hypothetical protein
MFSAFFKLFTIIVSYLFILCSPIESAFGKSGFLDYTNEVLVTIDKDSLHDFHLKFNGKKLENVATQSFSHYMHEGLQDNLINTDHIKEKIDIVGKDTIGYIINKAFCREVDYAQSHYVFYHGCKIDFLLFQDILKYITYIITKNALKNFFLFRIPTTMFNQYETAQQFLITSNYIINDSIDPDRIWMLAVNPSMFGNSICRETSSAFCYFLLSKSAFNINIFSLIADIFDHYNISELYTLYQNDIQELYDLLIRDELDKTGILMQIFIPKPWVDDITYRSLPRGVPYYSQSDLSKKSPSTELAHYQKNDPYIKYYSMNKLDTMQYRILLNGDKMLNIANGEDSESITMFRYYNQTASIKEYNEKLKKLKKCIARDIRKKGSPLRARG